VYGYDINPDYLAACETRYGDEFGDRLHLIEMRIDGSVRIERVDLLIANLIIEYVGIAEFVAFAAANSRSIGVLSCVIQRNDAEGFVSSTDYSSSFDALASVSSDIDPETLNAHRNGSCRPHPEDLSEGVLPYGFVSISFFGERLAHQRVMPRGDGIRIHGWPPPLLVTNGTPSQRHV
jgi:hypothetical protein